MVKFKEPVFLQPLPKEFDSEVVKRTIKIVDEVIKKENKKMLLEEIRQTKKKLRFLEREYQRRFGKRK